MILMRTILLVAILFTTVADAAKKKAVSRVLGNKVRCQARELARQDCQLRMGEIKIGFHQDRWRLNDGRRIAVNPMPLTQDGVEWHSIEIKKLAGRHLIEMALWAPISGEAAVQNLNWYVIEVEELASPLRVEQVVQRRRWIGVSPVNSERKPAAGQGRWQLDPREKTSLIKSGQKIHWRSGRHTGAF